MAVKREIRENTKKSQSQITLDPGMAQEYILQVSKQLEGKFTGKNFKDFSRKESLYLGALSKIVEILNPKVRICSIAVPGTSKNNDSENLESTGDRYLGDP